MRRPTAYLMAAGIVLAGLSSGCSLSSMEKKVKSETGQSDKSDSRKGGGVIAQNQFYVTVEKRDVRRAAMSETKRAAIAQGVCKTAGAGGACSGDKST